MSGLFHRLKEGDEEHHVVLKPGSGGAFTLCYGRAKKRHCSIIIAGLVLIILGLSIALAVTKVQNSHAAAANSLVDLETVCNTEECMIAAGEIIMQMDVSANPCEDFYQYACGNFVKKQFLGPAESRVGHFDLITKENNKILYTELTSNDSMIFGKKSSAAVKAKALHKQCMDVVSLQNLGSQPLLELFEELGNWTLSIDNVSSTEGFDFGETVLSLHKLRMFPLFSVSVSVDDKNSSQNIININQHGLTLSSERDYNFTYDKEKAKSKKEALIKYGIELFKLLGKERDMAAAAIANIYKFEKRLADVFVPQEIIRDSSRSYKKMQVSKLQALFGSHLSLKTHLSRQLNRTITDDTLVITHTYDYFVNMTSILSEYLSSPDKTRILMNYLTWYISDKNSGLLSTDFEYASLILSNVTDGINSLNERWKVCVDQLDLMMGRVIGALFIKDRFTAGDKKQVTNIITRVRNTLADNFKSYSWMDSMTAVRARDKALAVDTMIGYPDYITDASDIDHYYEKLEVGADGFFHSVLLFRRWAILKNADKLDIPANPKEWQMTASTVNAYYDPSHNMVVLPAGILRKPFYSSSLPLAWNYGSMAAVVGHEISHGFDDEGSQYDKIGNLDNWWTNSSRDGFNKAATCILHQYSQYRVQGKELNSDLGLGENIADNGGVALAHQAYKEKLSEPGVKPSRLPGLSLTDEQLFFLAFAQIWCVKEQPEFALSNLNYNPHSPSKFRVQGSFSNNPDFSRAFMCEKGDPYNPEQKCKVW